MNGKERSLFTYLLGGPLALGIGLFGELFRWVSRRSLDRGDR